jgi:hypothetical protein
MQEMNSNIDSIVRRTLDHAPGMHNSQLHDRRYDRHLVEQAVRRISQSMSRGKRFYQAVKNRGYDLKVQAVDLNRLLLNLQRLGSTFFAEQYEESESWGWDWTRNLPARNRLRVTMPTIEDGKRMQSDAVQLYRCSNISTKPLEHSVVLITPRIPSRSSPSRSPSPLRFHDINMVVRLGNEWKDVLIEPVRYRQGTSAHQSLRSAVKTLNDPSHGANLYIPEGSKSGDVFRVSLATRQRNSVRATDNRSLKDFLQESKGITDHRYISLSDRVAMICSLVEGSYHYLGSDWLRTLDTGCLKGGQASDGTWTMLLGNQGENLSRSEELLNFEIAALSDRDRRDLGLHCQIFRLGLVLAELALRKQINWIERDKSRQRMNIVIRDLQEEPLSAADIASYCDRETNSRTIGDLVFFCLSSLQNPRFLSDDHLNETYHPKALLP